MISLDKTTPIDSSAPAWNPPPGPAGVGTFIYAATGWLALLNGGNFLDYSYLPFKAEHTNELHALGILFIEILNDA